MSRLAILTRPASRNLTLLSRLTRAGWQALSAPALDIVALDISEPSRYLPAHYDLIVFVSGNAVRAYGDMLAAFPDAGAWPAHTAVAGVGPATLAAARTSLPLPHHCKCFGPAIDAASYDSESLYARLRDEQVRPGHVLIVRGMSGREWLADRLRADGAQVDILPAYSRTPAQWSASLRETLAIAAGQGDRATWLFTSAEGLSAVGEQMTALGLRRWWASGHVIVTHPRLVDALHACLAPETLEADSRTTVCHPDDDAIFEVIVAV